MQCWHHVLTGERACIGKHQIYMCVCGIVVYQPRARAPLGSGKKGWSVRVRSGVEPTASACRRSAGPLNAPASNRRRRSAGQPAGPLAGWRSLPAWALPGCPQGSQQRVKVSN